MRTAHIVSVWVLRLHRWLGLLLAAPLLVVATTGGLLLFDESIDRQLTPRLRLADSDPATHLSAGSVLKIARTHEPRQGVVTLLPPRPRLNSWIAVLDTPDSNFATRDWLFLHPVTGEVLLRRKPIRSLWGICFLLHTGLILGEAGESLFGVAGILLVVASLLGFWLWWPEKRWHTRTNYPAQLVRALHLIAGVLLLPLLLLLALTGALMVFHGPVAALAHGDTKRPDPRVIPGATLAGTQLGRYLDEASRQVPTDWTLRRISLPLADRPLVIRYRHPAEWHPNGKSYVHIDPWNGAVLAVERSDQTTLMLHLLNLLYPLHTGKMGDLPTRPVYLLAAMTLAYLSGSGFWLWWRHRVQPSPHTRSVRRGTRPHA